MPKVQMDLETSVPVERVRDALLDFTDRRPRLWPGIEPSLYEVYEVGETSADIKEGSRMPGMSVWAVEHYDWSQPGLVTWTVRRSNFCTPGSYVSAAMQPRAGGGTRVPHRVEPDADDVRGPARHVPYRGDPGTSGGRIVPARDESPGGDVHLALAHDADFAEFLTFIRRSVDRPSRS